ncbi:MAG TPA: amino acid ABC transporter permease [Actinomycetota bacterium]|nr:amino acid ABC transporter permease [Actinomycetota bacterium]
MAVGGGGEAHRVQYLPGDPRLPDERPTSKILAPLRAEGARGVLIAVVSTVLVLAVLVWLVVSSENWPAVRDAFFNPTEFKETFPDIARRFLRNVMFFMIAEPIILVVALFIAVLRSLSGAVFFPLRAMAIVYTDFFRGIPTVLVVYILGFGVPSLGLPGVPTDPGFWAVVGLVLSYSAYVSEVYRAGIESVHQSQVAAARSLGLSRWHSLRFVVIPQAVRRVIPPLLNDFVALQKDTALVAFVVAVPEAFKMAQIQQAARFNFTPLLAAALMFLIITVPLTRTVDWLIARERRRRQAGGAA